MATFLDLSLFGYFGSIFIFLFVFSVVWGLLTSMKIFKSVPGEKGIYGLIALSIGLLVMFSKNSSVLIATMAPWFTVLIIFIFLTFLVFRMFSGEDNSIIENAIKNPGVYWAIIILAIVILLASLSSTYGQKLLDDQTVQTVNIDNNNELLNENNQAVDVVENDDSVYISSNDDDVVAKGSTATENFDDNVLATIVHPKVMGLIMMMLIAFFTILLIAKTSEPI